MVRKVAQLCPQFDGTWGDWRLLKLLIETVIGFSNDTIVEEIYVGIKTNPRTRSSRPTIITDLNLAEKRHAPPKPRLGGASILNVKHSKKHDTSGN